MALSHDDMPARAEVQFDCTGVATGKMRNDLTVTMVRPFVERFEMATDEGPFHGGDASAPPPLALFVAGLTGCLMTQIRAFGKRLGVPVEGLRVETRVVWDWVKAGRVYETAPRGFEIDIHLDAAVPDAAKADLIAAARKGCFLEQTLGQANTIRHRLAVADGWREV
ncbi:MAG: OsmC-related (seleno)protein [Gemmobacter sp.]